MSKRYKVALVTGGAGFIGSHIVDALISRRLKVYVVDDLSTGYRHNVNPNARFFKISITSPAFSALVKRVKPDVIFHTAAQINVRCSVADPPSDARINIMGSLAVFHAGASSGVKKIVFSSSGGVMYPASMRPPYAEKIPPDPISPYGIAKRAAEMYLRFEHEVHGVEYVALRYANVYGPRQNSKGEAGVAAIFTERMLKGQPCVINGSGKQTRDYVFVEDVVRANLAAMKRGVHGIFNVGTGKETDVNAMFRKLKKLTGADIPERHGAACAGEVMRSALDARLAGQVLGWKPKVSLDEGLKRTVEWYKKQQQART